MNMEFIEALHDLEKEKGVSIDVLFEAIEAALISAYRKNFSLLQNVRTNIDRATGEIKVLSCKTVVEDVEDERQQISLEQARKLKPDCELDDTVEFEVTPRNFGRIAAQTAKQVVVQRIREAERGMIYDDYIGKEGDIVTGIFQRYEQKNAVIDLGKVEACMTATEQVPGEIFQPFERVRSYVVEVKKTSRGPQIFLSRTHPGLVRRLFELEVPEIRDGVIEIKNAVREAGSRTKIAVYSRDDNVDAIGACVGPKRGRIQTIVEELRGEKMDIIQWADDPVEFVANALSPAKVIEVYPYYKEKMAVVVVPDYQLSLAIGKEGQNARLAAKLTGWKIDIKSEAQAVSQGLLGNQYEEQEDYYDEDENGFEGEASGESASWDYAGGYSGNYKDEYDTAENEDTCPEAGGAEAEEGEGDWEEAL
ncbi:MAG: transcription termination factor NusA [Gracilibacteraceae bacterium]|nr:transcription termination factor NusA [Gracilibacteraceae bacterium]